MIAAVTSLMEMEPSTVITLAPPAFLKPPREVVQESPGLVGGYAGQHVRRKPVEPDGTVQLQATGVEGEDGFSFPGGGHRALRAGLQ